MTDSVVPLATPAAAAFALLHGAAALIEQGLAVFDDQGCLLSSNPAFLRLLGLAAEQAVAGTALPALLAVRAPHASPQSEGDQQQELSGWQQAVAARRAHSEDRNRSDGVIVRLRGEPLAEGGYALICSDVTEQAYIENLIRHQNVELEERVRRRTAQLENVNANLVRANQENSRIAAALRRSEARLRLINDTIPTLIGYFDNQKIYQYANKGYADWFNTPEGEINGNFVPDVIGPQVWGQVRENVEKALTGQQVTYEYSMERQGKTFHARSTLVPEFSPEGETLGCFVFAQDITESKRMQAALVQAQKMEAIGQLTGGLAHDFNNLLTVIIGNLAALQDRRGDDLEINEFLEPALQSSRRGVQLIKRLLTFSRREQLEPQVVNVGKLVRDMTTLIRRSLPESITISTDLPDAPMHSLVDPAQLESALLNFALNARDAMPDGGFLHVAVRLADLDEQAADFEVAPGRYVLIEVTDNGTGMDAATLTRVFEPFFTTKRLGLGSGLGLSMAYGFARQSGGGIRIRSANGQGTTVVLALQQGIPEADLDDVLDTAPLAHGGLLVLLVEDEPSVRRVVRQQLIDLGYPVIEADNGNQALELIEQVPDIALVLTDVVMPGGVNGRQLAASVMDERPEVGVVLMSGYADGWSSDQADQLPILDKPFSRQDLARALHAASRQKP